MTPLRRIAETDGTDAALKIGDHRIESLEDEVRYLRTLLRELSEEVTLGSKDSKVTAGLALQYLKKRHAMPEAAGSNVRI